jgi:hypothetical protein
MSRLECGYVLQTSWNTLQGLIVHSLWEYVSILYTGWQMTELNDSEQSLDFISFWISLPMFRFVSDPISSGLTSACVLLSQGWYLDVLYVCRMKNAIFSSFGTRWPRVRRTSLWIAVWRTMGSSMTWVTCRTRWATTSWCRDSWMSSSCWTYASLLCLGTARPASTRLPHASSTWPQQTLPEGNYIAQDTMSVCSAAVDWPTEGSEPNFICGDVWHVISHCCYHKKLASLMCRCWCATVWNRMDLTDPAYTCCRVIFVMSVLTPYPHNSHHLYYQPHLTVCNCTLRAALDHVCEWLWHFITSLFFFFMVRNC